MKRKKQSVQMMTKNWKEKKRRKKKMRRDELLKD
jgi:hypothetical protein